MLFAALAGTPPGGHGHPLRRHRPAQPRSHGRGSRRVLGRGDDRALGDTPGPTVARGLDRTRPCASAPGTAGAALTGALGARPLRGNGHLGGILLRSRTPPAPPRGSDRARLECGRLRGRDLALQEGVHGGPPGPPPATALGLLLPLLPLVRGLLGKGDLGTGRHRSRGRDRPGPAADRHLQHERAAAHARHLVRLQHTAVRPHDSTHDRLVHRVSPVYGPRTSIRTTSPRCAAATTTVLSM